jgi:hypothetical protein
MTSAYQCLPVFTSENCPSSTSCYLLPVLTSALLLVFHWYLTGIILVLYWYGYCIQLNDLIGSFILI